MYIYTNTDTVIQYMKFHLTWTRSSSPTVRLLKAGFDLLGQTADEASKKADSPDTPDSLLCCVKFFENVSEQTLAALEGINADGLLDSLKIMYVSPGDAIYIPGGMILLEKAVQANSVGIRVPSLLVDETVLPKLKLVEKHKQTSLESNLS